MPARYYDLGRFYGVDPKTAEFPGLSTYQYSDLNPIMKTDIFGMNADWYEDECGEVKFNPDVHNQKDLKDRNINGNYLFKEGFENRPGITNKLNADGTRTSLLNVRSEGGGWVRTAKTLTSGGGLSTYIWGEGFEAGANYRPKYAQRGVSMSSHASEAAQFSRYARYTSRAGNILTGADMILSGAEYYYSDRSWGDKTKLGVNLGIAGLGLVRHPAAQGLSVGLGIAETAGAFNGLYNYADDTQKSGLLIIPSGVFSPAPVIFKIR